MKLRSLLDSPPEFVKQRFASLRDPAEIKKRHDARAATMGMPLAPAGDIPRILAEVAGEHERLSDYRAKNGNYKLKPAGDAYVLTDRVYWRGIRNFLNPFTHRFSLLQFASALVAAAALPFALMKFVPMAGNVGAGSGHPLFMAHYLATALCYAVAGGVIGYALENHTFVWVFLLCFVAVHAAFGWDYKAGGFGLLAAWAGHFVAQLKERRRVFLLPQRPRANKRSLQLASPPE